MSIYHLLHSTTVPCIAPESCLNPQSISASKSRCMFKLYSKYIQTRTIKTHHKPPLNIVCRTLNFNSYSV